jgi:hypothetical protein
VHLGSVMLATESRQKGARLDSATTIPRKERRLAHATRPHQRASLDKGPTLLPTTFRSLDAPRYLRRMHNAEALTPVTTPRGAPTVRTVGSCLGQGRGGGLVRHRWAEGVEGVRGLRGLNSTNAGLSGALFLIHPHSLS